MRITVLGTGAWGTALAVLLSQNKHQVTLWSALKWQLEEIRSTGRNSSCLKGILLPQNFILEEDISEATKTAEVIVVAVASQYFRPTVQKISSFNGLVISVTKGIEFDTGLTMSGILKEAIPTCTPLALSGPSLADEVARGVPTAVVAACSNTNYSKLAQELFQRQHLEFIQAKIS